MAELAPLMTALLASCVETAQELAFRSPNGRLPIPFGFVLDEVASIAPLPELPALMATGGGSGILTLACCQDLSQVTERWGADQAQTIWANARVRLITPGAVDERTEDAAIRACGEVLELRRSLGSSRGRSHTGSGGGAQESAQETWRESWEPVIRKGDLARMPLGTALCIPAGCRPLHVELMAGRGLPAEAADATAAMEEAA
jgi:type IV secretory pathway TraG/TraD family ATPase VirD4